MSYKYKNTHNLKGFQCPKGSDIRFCLGNTNPVHKCSILKKYGKGFEIFQMEDTDDNYTFKIEDEKLTHYIEIMYCPFCGIRLRT